MSNNFSVLGNISKDPELKQVGTSQVLEFNLANNVGWGDKKITNWFKIAIWGKRGESLVNHLSKGSKVLVHGELALRPYTTNTGEDKISPEIRAHNIEFAGGKKSEEEPF